MNLRSLSIAALAAGALAAAVTGCGSDTAATIPTTPTHIIVVSGSNQVADVSAPLDSNLVVEVLDGASRPVSGITLTWSAIGGGTLAAATTTTDATGKSTNKFTLGSATGNQVVTVTSTQITGASVAFVASNGATLSGNVAINSSLPFAPTYTRSAGSTTVLSSRSSNGPVRYSNHINVGFKSGAIGLDAVGATSYRTMANARSASAQLATKVASVTQGLGVTSARISPALLAAQLTVDDTSRIDETIRTLAADPSVAWAERGTVTYLPASERHARATGFDTQLSSLLAQSAISAPVSPLTIATKIPNDPLYYVQSWMANMIDLPRAWAITTGSANVVVADVDVGARFDHPAMTNYTKDGYDFVTPFVYSTPQPICGGGTFTSTSGDGDGPDPDPTSPDDLEFDDTNNCWARSTAGDHGLWTASIIGAAGNQGIGVAGVNWAVKIRPIRVFDITEGAEDFDIAQGILYAAGLPAVGANKALVQTSRSSIINMSFGGGGSTVLLSALNSAAATGALLVASSGNDESDAAEGIYPANHPSVMAIAAVGMDGAIAGYSNAGTNISVAAPGGDFRIDDTGGAGVIGAWWNYVTGKPVYAFADGTSASAPYVSGVAALLLAQEPNLTAAQLRTRIETYAARPIGVTRSDLYGWGILNAYNALTQQNGPARTTIVRVIDASTGAVVRTTKADANGNFVFTKMQSGTFYVQAGEDEGGDGLLGVPGRRLGWSGTSAKPNVFNVNGNALAAAVNVGVPTEVEPNDDNAHANVLAVNSYVTGSVTPPDVRDVYSVTVPTAGTYVFETSGVLGACGWGLELDTFMSIATSTGAAVGTNDNTTTTAARQCSRLSVALTPGVYYVTISGSTASGLANHGRYRLSVTSS